MMSLKGKTNQLTLLQGRETLLKDTCNYAVRKNYHRLFKKMQLNHVVQSIVIYVSCTQPTLPVRHLVICTVGVENLEVWLTRKWITYLEVVVPKQAVIELDFVRLMIQNTVDFRKWHAINRNGRLFGTNQKNRI